MVARSLHVRDRNLVLTAVPPDEYERLLPFLHPMSLEENQVLIEPYKPIRSVYFPYAGAIALVMPGEGAQYLEAGMVGNEGVAGVCLALGSDRAPMRALAQTRIHGLKMTAAAFRAEMNRNGALAAAARRYAQGYMVMLSQGLVCMRSHRIEQRCSRWLLMLHDRVGAESFQLTHQALAHMLGVRRATVSEVAERLQVRGLVRYQRGEMTIVDRVGLERGACECYQIVRSELTRLLSLPASRRRDTSAEKAVV
jgi:CRP-like cAMP-binding protein